MYKEELTSDVVQVSPHKEFSNTSKSIENTQIHFPILILCVHILFVRFAQKIVLRKSHYLIMSSVDYARKVSSP